MAHTQFSSWLSTARSLVKFDFSLPLDPALFMSRPDSAQSSHVFIPVGRTAVLKMSPKARLWRSIHQNTQYICTEQFCFFTDLGTSWHLLLRSIRLSQPPHRLPELTSPCAAFLNCASASGLSPTTLSLHTSTGQQLNSVDLMKDVPLPFFFPK